MKPPPYVADFVFAREGRPLPYETEISFCILNFAFCIYIMCGAHYVLLFHSFPQLLTTPKILYFQGVCEILKEKISTVE